MTEAMFRRNSARLSNLAAPVTSSKQLFQYARLWRSKSVASLTSSAQVRFEKTWSFQLLVDDSTFMRLGHYRSLWLASVPAFHRICRADSQLI